MPQAKEQDRKPPPPEAWERAPRLTPTPCAREAELISDGGGLPFSPEAVFAAFEPLDPDDPPVKALLAQIDLARQQAQPSRPFRRRPAPPPLETTAKLAGWRALAGTDDEILYGRGRPPQLLTVAVRRGRRGRWSPIGASNSRPLRVTHDGVRASSWRLDPTHELAPGARELRILVTEQTMASGAPAEDRLLTPEIHVGSGELIVRIYVSPLDGYVGRTSRHETPVIVELPEPLGDRRVLDGALYEPPLA